MCKVKINKCLSNSMTRVIPFDTFLLETASLFLFYIHEVQLLKIRISDARDKSLQTLHQSAEASQLQKEQHIYHNLKHHSYLAKDCRNLSLCRKFLSLPKQHCHRKTNLCATEAEAAKKHHLSALCHKTLILEEALCCVSTICAIITQSFILFVMDGQEFSSACKVKVVFTTNKHAYIS